MIKAINIENTGKTIERILAITEPETIETNPTNANYIIIEDFPEAPAVPDHMHVNYPMYNKSTGEVIWVQIDYQYTATNELLIIENLKYELTAANENINMLTETIADMIGGAI